MSSQERTTLRVLNDQVDLGGGNLVPEGLYPGQIDWLHVRLSGRDHHQIGRVLLRLTQDQLDSIFGDEPRASRDGAAANVTKEYLRGDIVKV